MNKAIITALSIMLVLLAACGKPTVTGAVTGVNTTEPTDAARLDLYVMSQCPYGVQSVNEMPAIKERLGKGVDINIEYIGAEQNGKFQSLHGEPEIIGDTIQLCVKKHYPDKMIDFAVCQNNNDPRDLTQSIDKCAEQTGIDAETIKTCYKGDEGEELLRRSFAKASEAGAQASPTIIIEGEQYKGARDSLSVMRAICEKKDVEGCDEIPACATDFDCANEDGKEGYCENPGEASAACVLKEPTEFELVVINDKRCEDCDVSDVVAVFEQNFPGVKITRLDSSEATELIEANNIELAPAILVQEGVTESKMWKINERMREAFVEADYGYQIVPQSIGAKFIIDDEKRAEKLQALGITLGDNRPQVDFFVMSYCPYGNQAEEGLAPVYGLLGEKVEWNPRYVIYSNYKDQSFCYDEEQKYCSMHGLVELNQGVRELCVMDLYGREAWFDFAIEMNTKADYKNADEKWEGVAEELGYDTAKIQECFEANAETKLEADLKLGKAYGVSGSPTVFIDGEKYSGQRTPRAYAEAICAAFDEAPAECEQLDTLGAGSTAQPTGGCGI